MGGEEHGFRFIQLPFNVAMTEALTVKGQRIADEPMTTFEAAKRLGIGVFVSAPQAQGRPGCAPSDTRDAGLEGLSLLQLVRYAHPAIIAPLVGQKDPAHVRDNLRLSSTAPLDTGNFEKLYGSLVGKDQD